MTVTESNSASHSVTMICPNLNCGRTVTTPSSNRGRTARCPYCNALFRVPQESSHTGDGHRSPVPGKGGGA
ncbi:MAG: hypothetical protein LC135_06735 [Phycisphaerae bacterium]|nr:hypothetical protein [Phycisphaerae bacterium]MCZ2399551.1 hypothetical protein [Phycisphaerae bacterium]